MYSSISIIELWNVFAYLSIGDKFCLHICWIEDFYFKFLYTTAGSIGLHPKKGCIKKKSLKINYLLFRLIINNSFALRMDGSFGNSMKNCSGFCPKINC